MKHLYVFFAKRNEIKKVIFVLSLSLFLGFQSIGQYNPGALDFNFNSMNFENDYTGEDLNGNGYLDYDEIVVNPGAPSGAEFNLFETLKNGNPILIDFYVPSCGWCRTYSPIIEEVYETHGPAGDNTLDVVGVCGFDVYGYEGYAGMFYFWESAVYSPTHPLLTEFPTNAQVCDEDGSAGTFSTDPYFITGWPAYIMVCPDRTWKRVLGWQVEVVGQSYQGGPESLSDSIYAASCGCDPIATETNDAKLYSYVGPDQAYVCSTDYSPILEIQSRGTETMTSVNIIVNINGEDVYTYEWTGLLEQYDIEEVTINNVNLPIGENLITFRVEYPNGEIDENNSNDELSVNVNFPELSTTIDITCVLRYVSNNDLFWTIYEGDDIISSVAYNNPDAYQTHYHEICLEDNKCYNFEIVSEGGYGFGSNESLIIEHNGEVIITVDASVFSGSGGNPVIFTQEFCVGSQGEEQVVNLPNGYSFASTRIIPENLDMMVVLNDILNDNLDFVRNSNGNTLRKIGPVWVNGIGDWITTEGYLFKMNTDDQLTFEGSTIDPTTVISLHEGFQFVSYLPDLPIDATVAFDNVLNDNLIYIRDSQGGMLRKIGPNWVNGIGDCNPGQGYLIKMFADDELVYNIPSEATKSSVQKKAIKYFTFEGGNAADPVYTIYISGLSIGDEVAAYDGNVMVGSTVIVSENTLENALPIFSTLTSQKGYANGNNITLKVWDNNSQSRVASTYTFVDEYEETYNQNTYPVEDGKFSVINITKNLANSIDAEADVSIYPNPSTDFLNVVANDNISRIRIINFIGQVMFDNVINNSSVNINTSDYQSGVYIISVETNNGVRTEKITIK